MWNLFVLIDSMTIILCFHHDLQSQIYHSHFYTCLNHNFNYLIVFIMLTLTVQETDDREHIMNMILSTEVKLTTSTQPSPKTKITDTDSVSQIQAPILKSPKGLFTKFLSRNKKLLLVLPVSPTSVATVPAPPPSLHLPPSPSPSLPVTVFDATSHFSTAPLECTNTSSSCTYTGGQRDSSTLPQEQSIMVPYNQIHSTPLTPRSFERHSNFLASQPKIPCKLQLNSKPYNWENCNKNGAKQEDLNYSNCNIKNENIVDVVDYFHGNDTKVGGHRNDIMMCKEFNNTLSSKDSNEVKRECMMSCTFGSFSHDNDNCYADTNSDINSSNVNNFRDVSGSIDLYDTDRGNDNYSSISDIYYNDDMNNNNNDNGMSNSNNCNSNNNNNYNNNYNNNNNDSNNNKNLVFAEKNRNMNIIDDFSNNFNCNYNINCDDALNKSDIKNKNYNNNNNNNNNYYNNWRINNETKEGCASVWDRKGSQSTEIINYRESVDYYDHSSVESSSKTFNLTEMSRSLSFLSFGVHGPSLDDMYLQPTQCIPRQNRVGSISPAIF